MLKLVPPGKRGGGKFKNKYWLVRGSIDGNEIEKSLGVSLRSDAEKKLRELLRQYDAAKNCNENVTFGIAADRYIAYRDPGYHDLRYIKLIRPELEDKLVTEITQNDLVTVANKLYPDQKASSKNRAVIRPAAAILHYAADNNWCPWLRIKTFKESTPLTRYVNDNVELALLKNTTGKKHLLIVWLFKQGDRIGDTLQIKYEDCDFEAQTVSRHVSKSDRYMVLPLDQELCAMLKPNQGDPKPTGYIFPWQTKSGVHKWMRPLCKSLNIEFTPHRARHTLGKRLNDSGAGLKTIMQALGQFDPKSAIRYQTTDVETIRLAKGKANERRKPLPENNRSETA